MNEVSEYKDIQRQLRKQKLVFAWNRAKYMFNIFPEARAEKLIKQNKAPDISTITEHIAFVIDNEIVEIIHCQPKMAAILLSEPQIVKIEDGLFPKVGWKYEDGNFKEPVQEMPEREITTARDSEAIEHGLPTFKEFQENMKNMSTSTFKDFINSLRKKKNNEKDLI